MADGGSGMDTSGPRAEVPTMAQVRGRDRRRRRHGLVAIGVVAVLAAVVGYGVWEVRTDRRTGPAPTVSSADSCGGGAPSAVLAIDAATGAQRWSALVGESFELGASPDAVVLTGSERLRVLDPDRGRARWCREAEEDGQVLDAVVAGDTVVVADGGGSIGGFAAGDGRERWTEPLAADRLWATDDVAVVTVDGPPEDQPADGPITAQQTHGLDAATGRERWSYPSSPGLYDDVPIPLLPAPDLGLTFVHDGIGVAAVGDGGVRWTSPLFRPIGLADGLLLGGVAQTLGGRLARFDLQAVDASTGVERWRRDVPGFDARLVGGVVVVLHPTDPEDAPGIEGYSTSNGDGPVSGRSPASRTMATAYDPADGSVRWQRELPFAARIDAVGGKAIAWIPAEPNSRGDGRLLALDPADGSVAWRADLPNPGRSQRYHLGDDVTDVAVDEGSGTLYLLLTAQEPYRD